MHYLLIQGNPYEAATAGPVGREYVTPPVRQLSRGRGWRVWDIGDDRSLVISTRPFTWSQLAEVFP